MMMHKVAHVLLYRFLCFCNAFTNDCILWHKEVLLSLWPGTIGTIMFHRSQYIDVFGINQHVAC